MSGGVYTDGDRDCDLPTAAPPTKVGALGPAMALAVRELASYVFLRRRRAIKKIATMAAIAAAPTPTPTPTPIFSPLDMPEPEAVFA